jgi:hypothetical protein
MKKILTECLDNVSITCFEIIDNKLLIVNYIMLEYMNLEIDCIEKHERYLHKIVIKRKLSKNLSYSE